MVRLAAGLDANDTLSRQAMDRGIECLSRFGQRLRHLKSDSVRVVGTNTLRKARNGWEFISRAEAVIGHPIEIISGREEARLIYKGVCYAMGPAADRRLVIDIGGGSTELILGRGYEPELMDSLYMGCVSMSERFFDDGELKARPLQRGRTRRASGTGAGRNAVSTARLGHGDRHVRHDQRDQRRRRCNAARSTD